MIKEYKTISEVAGPLMLVKDVENVTYDELGEITLPNGEKRLCRVLEIDGSDALVQLFENSAGIYLFKNKESHVLTKYILCVSLKNIIVHYIKFVL